MTRCRAFVAALALGAVVWGWTPLARAAEPGPFGRRISQVSLEGAPQEVRRLTQIPVQSGRVLSRESLQHAVRLLYRTGRFSRVLAWIENDGADQVAVRFDVELLQRVTRLSFNGAQALEPASLTKAADLPPGTEFSPERAEKAAADVAAEYFSEGYRSASVRWDAVPFGSELAVDFSVVEGPATVLDALHFAGDLGLSDTELRVAFGLELGERIVQDKLDRGTQELRLRLQRRGFFRARVLAPTVTAREHRGVVVVPVEAGPHFRFLVRGATRFTESELLARMRSEGAAPLDGPMQHELAERLRAFYELAGYPAAKVLVRESAPPSGVEPGEPDDDAGPAWFDAPGDEPAPVVHEIAPPDQERLVSFVVREGEPVRVQAREFPGLTAFTKTEFDRRIDVALEDTVPRELVEGRSQAMLASAGASGSPGAERHEPWRVVPKEVFSTAAYRVACGQLRDLYKSQGYLDARVGPARLVPGPGGSSIAVVPVEEGPRTIVASVQIEGVEHMPAERVQALLSVKAGAPLSFAAVEEMRQAVSNLYQAEGYAYADVQDDEEIDNAGTSARVRLRVTEGPLVKVSRIELKGLGRTDPQLVRDALSIQEGDVLTPQARQDSLRNLLRLGIFASASVGPAEADAIEPEKVLVVEVREKPSFSADLKGGASYADGPRASLAMAWTHLRGRNWTAGIGAKLNWPVFRFCLVEEPDQCTSAGVGAVSLERRLNASLVAPQLQGAGQTPFDLRLDLVHESVMRPSYKLSKIAGLVSADGLLRARLFGLIDSSVILQGEVERDEFERRKFQLQFQTQADRRALLLPEGTILLASVRPALTLDARDDPMNPTRGAMLGVSLDFAQALDAVDRDGSPFDIRLVRTLMSLSGYVPIVREKRVVLAVSSRVGRVFKQAGSYVIGTKRFFLGGNQSLRGFSEDGVYPQDLRDRDHEALQRCQALATGLGCDDATRRRAAGVGDPSPGGELSLLGRAELRFGLGGDTTDGALFLDAGNLWADAGAADLTRLRYAAGFGLRYQLPIGPAAFDFGFNLARDAAFGEPPFRIHLSVGLF